MRIISAFSQKYGYNSNFNSNIHKYSSKPELNENKNKKGSEVYFSGEYYRSLLNIDNKKNVSSNNITFGNLYHKTISSKVPVYRPCCTTYDDIDEFSRQFCEKINSQIQNPSIEDVERLIENVKKETGADERLVKEVVFRLSQFSSFNSLKYINGILKSRSEKIVEYTPWHCLNSSLIYLGNKFGFFKKNTQIKKSTEAVSFIDDFILRASEPFLNAKFNFKDFFSRENVIDKTQLRRHLGLKSYILDGFDVLTSEGKYCGANFMSGTGYLEALSIDVIKQIQNGKDIEDIMHGDLEKRFREQFRQDSFYKHREHPIEIIRKPMPLNIKSEDILENLKENELDPETVKKTIETGTKIYMGDSLYENLFEEQFDDAFSAYLSDDASCKINLSKKFNKEENVWEITLNGKTFKVNEKNIETALMKYLDVFSNAFSAHSMSGLLNEAGEILSIIEESSGRKNVYLVPDISKSYSLLTYMFMKNNEIGYKNSSYPSKNSQDDSHNFVVIDDASISGMSEMSVVKNYCSAKNTNYQDIYFVPVTACEHARTYTENMGYYNTITPVTTKDMANISDFVSDTKYADNPDEFTIYPPLTYKDMCILYILIEKGYRDCASAIAFPYILPDNNSDFASEILAPLLTKVTIESKKS